MSSTADVRRARAPASRRSTHTHTSSSTPRASHHHPHTPPPRITHHPHTPPHQRHHHPPPSSSSSSPGASFPIHRFEFKSMHHPRHTSRASIARAQKSLPAHRARRTRARRLSRRASRARVPDASTHNSSHHTHPTPSRARVHDDTTDGTLARRSTGFIPISRYGRSSYNRCV